MTENFYAPVLVALALLHIAFFGSLAPHASAFA